MFEVVDLTPTRLAFPSLREAKAGDLPLSGGGIRARCASLAPVEAASDLKRVPNVDMGRQMARMVELRLNGRTRVDAVPDNLLLLDYLREVVGLTGTKTGCDGGECGACTVLVDDRPRLSCLTLAAAMDGRRVDTVESLAQGGRLSAVQRGFHEKLGSQCGYCTPGFIMASAGLLRRNPHPGEEEIRAALGSNICRCTGYVKIIEAVKYAAELHACGASP
jgi:4-hydroxybenzoyl-CoA reductase subunit gamma